MSIVGIDFGNMSTLIAQTSKGGVDVILNDASNRQTASCMSFQGKQRYFGDAASSMARSNVKNTVSLMKLLVGRRYDEPAVQRELARAPYRHCAREDGGVGIIVEYDNEQKVLAAEHVMGMMLSLAKTIAYNANSKVPIGDAVLAVPCWYTDAQRRGVLDACAIVGLNCLKVVNETTAIALSYGIYKSAKGLFSETDPVHVMFIDVGLTCYSVVIVDYVQEKLVVRSTAWDQSVGGREIDALIVEYLCQQFEAKTKIDVRKNPKALLKLEAAAEKAKKTLSPAGVAEAVINVECLAEDSDLNCKLSLEELESRVSGVIAKLEAPILSALAEANLTRDQLSDIEIVGGSSRVQCVKRSLGAILGLDPAALNYGLKTTMNADEAVARGGALQCAILSSRVKVKPFNVTDAVQYPVEVAFEASGVAVGGEGEEDGKAGEGECKGECKGGEEEAVQIFSRGDEVPHKPRRLTFRNKNSSFDVTVRYGASAVAMGGDSAASCVLPQGTCRTIGSYRVHVPEAYTTAVPAQGYDVRLTFGLDRSGCVYVVSAHLMEEVADESEPDAPAAPAAEGEGKEGEGKEGEGKEGEGKEGEAPAPAAPKRRLKKVDLEITSLQTFALSAAAVQAAIELESAMTIADTLIRETADKRNELESFVYTMRDKLDSALKEYCTEAEKASLTADMEAAEEWLYGDGFESTKAEYMKKIDALKGPSALIEFRCSEEQNRPEACEQLKQHVGHIRTFAANTDADHDHITAEERDTLREEADKIESWMYDMLGKQADRRQYEDPVMTCESMINKRQEMHGKTNAILSKKRPKVEPPAPVPEARSEEKGEEEKSEEKGEEEKGEEEKSESHQPADNAEDTEEKEEKEPAAADDSDNNKSDATDENNDNTC
jgi:heat shock protein 4